MEEQNDVVFLEDDRLSRLLPPAVRTVEMALYQIIRSGPHPFLQYALTPKEEEEGKTGLGFPSFALDLSSSDHDNDAFEMFKKELVLQLMQWLSLEADDPSWFPSAFRGFVQDPEIQTKVLAVVDYEVLRKQQQQQQQQQQQLVWATIDEIVFTQQRIATKIAQATTAWFYLDDSLMWLRIKGTNERVDTPLVLFLMDKYSADNDKDKGNNKDQSTSNQTMLAEKERNYKYVATYGPLYLFLTQPLQGMTSMHDRYAVFPGDDCRYELVGQERQERQVKGEGEGEEGEEDEEEEKEEEDTKQTPSLYFVEDQLVTTQVVYGMRTRDRFVLLH